MPPLLALLFGASFVVYTIRSDRKRSTISEEGLFWPTLWYMVVCSHPIGYWLMQWGLPVPGGGDDPTDGSLPDRLFYGVLMVIGFRILARRRFNWGAAIQQNRWLTALIAFMALSILWSQYPFVSFKRYIKVIGSIVMAMVVLTGDDPLESFLTLLRRCLCVHLPMSIICTRYFRDIGVSFEWNGTVETWEGISTSKNVLGQVTMLGVMVFYWELRRRWKEVGWKNIYLVYLLMAIYLLKGSANAVSMTSVAVCLFSLLIFLRMQSLRNRPASLRTFVLGTFGATVALITLVMVHSISPFSENSLFGQVITSLGRDITMTGRTEIWHDVYAAASGNPLLGVGFGGFWIGRIANIPWNAHMSWVLGQAHSGYVDTYLQIGLVGSFLMAVLFCTTVFRLLNSLNDDFDFGCFRITLFLTILFINITEAVYLRGDHHLWLILLLSICMAPAPTNYPAQDVVEVEQLDQPQRPHANPNHAV